MQDGICLLPVYLFICLYILHQEPGEYRVFTEVHIVLQFNPQNDHEAAHALTRRVGT